MICDNCNQDKSVSISAVLNSKYGSYCPDCIGLESRQSNGQSAEASRNHDRETHAKDMLQPWLPDGQPNTQFIRSYPDSAKDMYTTEELENYG